MDKSKRDNKQQEKEKLRLQEKEKKLKEKEENQNKIDEECASKIPEVLKKFVSITQKKPA